MTESMLQAAGLNAIAVGNVGTPILDAIRDPVDYDVIAVELSSFQLHWSHSMSPLASVCLNVAEDHVDWHGSYAYYLADKAKVYEHTQRPASTTPTRSKPSAWWRTPTSWRAAAPSASPPHAGISMVGVVEDLLVDRAFIADRKDSAAELASWPTSAVGAPRHMVANAPAAAALVRAYGVEPAAVAWACATPSGGPPHPGRGPPRRRAVDQRFQGDQPARGRASLSPSSTSSGSPAGFPRASTTTRWSRSSASGSRPWC